MAVEPQPGTGSGSGDDTTEPPAEALADLVEAVRRARGSSLRENLEEGCEPITPIVWLYREDVRVGAFRCAQASLIDALDLVLNAVPTYVADTVALAFEGPPYEGPGPGDRSAHAIHVVRRQRDGRWHVGCLPYTIESSEGGGSGPHVDWLDERLPGLFSSGSTGDELELQGLAAAALEEAFARAPLVTEELLVQLQEELDMDAVDTRHRADLDVTHALLAFGRGRWCVDPGEAPHSSAD
jgi:hypothetical protein